MLLYYILALGFLFLERGTNFVKQMAVLAACQKLRDRT